MSNEGFDKILPLANSSSPKEEADKEKIIERAAEAYAKYLDALGFDWRSDPNSVNTPLRVAKAFVNDIARGCYDFPPTVTAFPNNEGYDGMVCQTGIPVKSLCSHHHAPFTGRCHVAYIPSKSGHVVGLSKLNRIVEYYARRPQIQEGLTMQIHNAINEICKDNKGVAVLLSCQHTCVCNRGVKHDGCMMSTSRLSGDFLNDPATRDEFYRFVEMSSKQCG